MASGFVRSNCNHFCEKGLVFAPFPPGDSLLFLLCFLAAGEGLKVWIIILILSVAAILGDSVKPDRDIFRELAERLKELKEEGLFERRVDVTSFPMQSEYILSESGLEIIEIIRDIKRWALTWKIENIACGDQDSKVCVL